jgi:hypothetical protein
MKSADFEEVHLEEVRTHRIEQPVPYLMRHDVGAGARKEGLSAHRLVEERKTGPIVEGVEIFPGILQQGQPLAIALPGLV